MVRGWKWGGVRETLSACAWTLAFLCWVENYSLAAVDPAFGDASKFVKVYPPPRGGSRFQDLRDLDDHGPEHGHGHGRGLGHGHGGAQPTLSEAKRREIVRNIMMQRRAYSIVDSSRVSTFLISILLIVYGSFRSLNMEQEAKERELEKEKERSGSSAGAENNVQTLDAMQAMCLPLGASVSLLVMFFFFDSMQMLFAICTAIIATVALAFLLLPMCQYVLRPCTSGNKMSFGACGRFTAAEMVSFGLSISIVAIWVLTGHWLLMDAMGMGLCVAFIAFVRLPSLKVSTLLLTGLLLYDVFWVFFSSYIFNANVMVKVATRPADNPVGLVAKKLHLNGLVRDAPKLSLPGKLVFPSMNHAGHFSMLGLGDIVMPGLLLCFVMRYDAYKRAQLIQQLQMQGLDVKACGAGSVDGAAVGAVATPPFSRMSYFHCSLIGYFLGLLTATVSSEVFKAAQPALLYLVPFTLLPLLTMAYLKGDLRRMWSEPFISTPIGNKHQVV